MNPYYHGPAARMLYQERVRESLAWNAMSRRSMTRVSTSTRSWMSSIVAAVRSLAAGFSAQPTKPAHLRGS